MNDLLPGRFTNNWPFIATKFNLENAGMYIRREIHLPGATNSRPVKDALYDCIPVTSFLWKCRGRRPGLSTVRIKLLRWDLVTCMRVADVAVPIGLTQEGSLCGPEREQNSNGSEQEEPQQRGWPVKSETMIRLTGDCRLSVISWTLNPFLPVRRNTQFFGSSCALNGKMATGVKLR